MTKEQFKQTMKEIFENSQRKPVGKSEYEKQLDEESIKVEEKRFSNTISHAIYSLPMDKFKEVTKLFTEKEKISARTSTLSSTLGSTYIDEHKIDKNTLSDEFKAYSKNYYKTDYERYQGVIGKYMTKKEFDDIVAGIKDKKPGGYVSIYTLKDKVVDVILKNGKIEENQVYSLKEAVADAGVPTSEEIMHSANFVPKEEFETNTKLFPEVSINSSNCTKYSDKFIDFIVENYDEKQLDEIVEYSKTQGSRMKLSNKEISVPKFEDEINAIRNSGVTPEQEEALKFIEENMVDIDSDFSSELGSYRRNIESAMKRDEDSKAQEYRKKENIDNVVIPTKVEFSNGSNEKDKTTVMLLNENASPDLVEKYKNMDMKYSPETQKAFVDVINKMDKYGIISDVAIAEQGTKIYGLHQYNNVYKEIKTALQNGEKEKLPELVNKNKQIMKQYEDIFEDIRKGMPVHEGNLAYGGNLDVEREDTFPPQYRRDIPTISAFNGLYVIGSYLKANNIKPEDYIKNPKKYVDEAFKKYYEDIKLKPQDFKGKSVGDIAFDIQADTTKRVFGAYAFIRLMENTADLERDPEIRNHNKAVYLNFDDAQNAFMEYKGLREVTYGMNIQLMQKMMLVPDEQRTFALNDGVDYNPIEMKITKNKPFDDLKFIETNEIDLKEFNDKIERSIKDYDNHVEAELEKDPDYTPNLSRASFVKMAHNLATKVALIKPEQKNDPEYKRLMEFVNDPKKTANKMVDAELNYDDLNFYDAKDMKEEMDEFVKKQSGKSKKYGKTEIDKDKALNKLLNGKKDYEIENHKKEIDDRMKELTEGFRKGEIPEDYYKARMEQLKNRDFKSDVPPMFLADKMPSMKDWAKQNEIDDLPKNDQKLAYNRAKEKAKRDKEMFFKRQYMKEQGLDKTEVLTLEEMNPELKGTDKIVSADIKDFGGVGEDYLRTDSNNVELDESMDKKSELNESQIIMNEIDSLGEKMHIDLDEKEEVKTSVIKDNGKNKTKEKETIKK